MHSRALRYYARVIRSSLAWCLVWSLLLHLLVLYTAAVNTVPVCCPAVCCAADAQLNYANARPDRSSIFSCISPLQQGLEFHSRQHSFPGCACGCVLLPIAFAWQGGVLCSPLLQLLLFPNLKRATQEVWKKIRTSSGIWGTSPRL